MFSQNRGVEFMPNMGTLLSRPQAIGRVFFVHLFTGLNTNNGIDPSSPFQTITYALSQCVAGRNDYIIVLDAWQGEPAYPIDVNVSWVHIIGLDFGNGGPIWMSPTGDTALFTVGNAEYFEIAGFNMGGGGTHGVIEGDPPVAPAQGRGIIHHCRFGWDIAAQDGIRVLGTKDLCIMDIHDNLFGGLLTRDGIRLDGTSTRSLLHHNLFRDIPGIGIHCQMAGSDIGAIQWNYFKTPKGGAVGAAITMLLDVGNALITDNRATEDAENPGNSPYKDFSTGVVGTTLNAWAANYSGNVLVYPTVV